MDCQSGATISTSKKNENEVLLVTDQDNLEKERASNACLQSRLNEINKLLKEKDSCCSDLKSEVESIREQNQKTVKKLQLAQEKLHTTNCKLFALQNRFDETKKTSRGESTTFEIPVIASSQMSKDKASKIVLD